MSREQVVLLHGLAETPFHMAALALALRLDGYEVANVGYPSTVESTEALAKAWLMPLFERFAGAERLHFVTHSMGGVMLHRGLLELRPANLGRVVMQTPAAHGSPFLEAFRPTWLYRMIFGPAGQEAGQGQHCYACGLDQQVDYELGVIAGSFSPDPLAAVLVPWPNDGRASVGQAPFDGARHVISVPASHDLVPFHPWAVWQTLYFLHHGRFYPAKHQADFTRSSGEVIQAMAS